MEEETEKTLADLEPKSVLATHAKVLVWALELGHREKISLARALVAVQTAAAMELAFERGQVRARSLDPAVAKAAGLDGFRVEMMARARESERAQWEGATDAAQAGLDLE